MEGMPVVVDELTKVFKVPVREAGLRESVKSLFKREHKMVRAVDGISFEVAAGEIVGFLGPNGAGKTTTLKMLTGLLHADGGTADVLGHTPWKRSKELLSQITLVLGQRQNLAWDLPALRAEYDRFLADTAGLDAGSLPPALAAAELTGVVHRWRRFPFLDPDIPRELLEIDWPGPAAAQRFADLRTLLSPPAMAWWSATENATT